MTPNALTSAGLPMNVQVQDISSESPARTLEARESIESIQSIQSVDALYRLYSPRIFRFLLSSLRDRDLAESFTQDTFVRAWNARDSFRGECAIGTWLTRIALNLVRDHTRTNRFRFWRKAATTAIDATELAGQLQHPASSHEARLIAQEQVALVAETVATLSERQRTVFLLRFVEELELNEIASITGMPVSTVKTHLYRGLAIVRARHSASSRKESR